MYFYMTPEEETTTVPKTPDEAITPETPAE